MSGLFESSLERNLTSCFSFPSRSSDVSSSRLTEEGWCLIVDGEGGISSERRAYLPRAVGTEARAASRPSGAEVSLTKRL